MARPQQARHLHLRAPEDLGDLGLGDVVVHPHPQRPPLKVRQSRQRDDERLLELEQAVPVLVATEHLDQRLRVLRRPLRHGRVERDRVLRRAGIEPDEHLVDRDLQVGGDRRCGGRAAALGGDHARRARHPQRQLLGAARDVRRPTRVAEVPLELTEDGGDGERGEADAALDVETVDRTQQSHRGDLDEVLDRLLGVAVAVGQPAGERQEPPAQLLAGGGVAVVLASAKQLAELARGHGGVGQTCGGGHRAPRERWKCDEPGTAVSRPSACQPELKRLRCLEAPEPHRGIPHRVIVDRNLSRA